MIIIEINQILKKDGRNWNTHALIAITGRGWKNNLYSWVVGWWVVWKGEVISSCYKFFANFLHSSLPFLIKNKHKKLGLYFKAFYFSWRIIHHFQIWKKIKLFGFYLVLRYTNQRRKKTEWCQEVGNYSNSKKSKRFQEVRLAHDPFFSDTIPCFMKDFCQFLGGCNGATVRVFLSEGNQRTYTCTWRKKSWAGRNLLL